MRKLGPAAGVLAGAALAVFTLIPPASFAAGEARKKARIAGSGAGENAAPFLKPSWLRHQVNPQSFLFSNQRSSAAAIILWEDNFEGSQPPWTPVASWTNTPVNPADPEAGFVFGDHSGWTRVDTISQRPPGPKHAWRNDDDENTAIDLLISPVIHLPRTVEGKPLLKALMSFYVDLHAPDAESAGNLQDFFYVRPGRAEALWRFESVVSFSATSHWALRQDATDAKGAFNVQALITPEIDLAGARAPVLSFLHQYVTELNYDYCAVDVSLDQFASYKTLVRYSGLRAANVNAGVNLANYAGRKVRLRFRFISDFSYSRPGARWFIDDIAVRDSARVLFADDGGDSGRSNMIKWGFMGGDTFAGLDYDKDPNNPAAIWLKKDAAGIARGTLNVFDCAAGIAPGDSIRLAFHWVTNGSLSNGNGRGIFVDQVALEAVAGVADDVAFIDLDVPFPNYENAAAQTAVARVRNRGLNHQNAAPVHYRLDAGAAVSPAPALLFDLPPAAEKSAVFNWKAPGPGVYRLTAFTNLAADFDRSNDSLSVAPVAVYPHGVAELGYDDRFNQNLFITGSKSLVSFTVREDLRGAAQKYALPQVKVGLFNGGNSNDQVRLIVATARDDTTLQTVLFEKIEPVPAHDFSWHVLQVNAKDLTAERFAVLVDFGVSSGHARLLMDGGTRFTGHNFFFDGARWSPSSLGRHIRATVSWLDSPPVLDVRDAPNDQGRRVQVSWFPATSEGFSRDIAHYIVWRAVKNRGAADTNFRVIEVPNMPALHEYGIQYGRPGDRLVVSGGGAWDFIITRRAQPGLDAYGHLAPTLQDSNATGINHSVFMVAAHRADLAFAEARIDSGYSADNLAPAMPLEFTAARITVNQRPAVQLQWQPVADDDLAHYAIYKNDGAAPLATTTASSFTDLAVAAGTAVRYGLAAFDVNGNQSPRAHVSLLVTGVEESPRSLLPANFELGSNRPNPFNPETAIAFALPVRARVQLTVYNFLGQEVENLISAEMPAGFHEVVWRAKARPSGIYFYRLTAEAIAGGAVFQQARKMLLAR